MYFRYVVERAMSNNKEIGVGCATVSCRMWKVRYTACWMFVQLPVRKC